jgi:hypothetical protein
VLSSTRLPSSLRLRPAFAVLEALLGCSIARWQASLRFLVHSVQLHLAALVVVDSRRTSAALLFYLY